MSWFDRLMGSSGVDQNDDYIRQIDGAAAAEAAAQAEAAADDNAWKYLSVGDLLGLSDYTNRNYNYRMIPFLGQIVGHASDAATQGVADVAQFLGAQGISDYLNEKAQKGEAELPAMSKPEASLAYLTDPNGLASAFGMMGGSFLSMAPMAAIAPELLPARAAAVLSRVPKALSAVPKIGGALEEMAPMAGRFALTGPIEAMMEGGNTEREMLRNGATPEEARQAAWDVFNENVGLLTATNALEGGLLGKLKIKTPKFSNPVVNTASRAAGYIPTTAAEMALQGYEEGAQQGIQNGVEGQSPNTANQILNPFAWTDAQLDAAKMGIAGAAPLMGAMGVARHFGNRQAQDAQTQAVNDAIRAQQAEADAEFAPVSFGDTDVSAPEIAAPKGQARKAGTDVLAAAQDYMGQHMDNGENGCVEAVTKIGANYNAFLADELGRGVVNVDTLVKDAGDSVVPFDASNVQAGDVIVYGDNDHVVIADGNGGYVGNSSSKQVVVQGDDYNEMGGLKPTKIIKTGSDAASSTDSGQGSADLSGLAGGGIASAIAQRTGLPANLIWAQLAHESDGFSSQLAREDHNYGGITNSDGSYRHFDSDEDFVDFMANYYPKYKENGLYNARNADEWASALKDGGYFTADLGEYEGGMKRHLADAGLPDGVMPGDNMKGEAASVGIPDFDTLLGNAEAGDDFTKGFYQGAADYILNTAVDEDAISAVSQMTNRKGDFRNTKENRLALATKFADELADYYDTLSANLAQNAPQAAGQPASALQVQSAARSAETPHIEKAETPAIDKAKAQQNMRTNTSFRMEDAPQAGQADAQEMQIARSLAPKMQQAIFRTARNIAVGMQARGQENTQDFMRLRDAIQRRDYGAMMQMYPQEMQSAVAPIVQRGMEELSAKPQEPVQTGKPAAQIAQGRNLIQLAQQNHVSLPSGMVRYLNAGHRKAIDAAEERLQQAGVPLTEMKGVNQHETNQYTESQAAPRSEAAGHPYQNAESGKGRADAEESEVAPSPHFDTSDFQHTKTGEMIPAAKATERTSKEDFASLKSIAKQNGGYYNRFAKRFLFKDGAGRDAFAQVAEREVFGGAQPQAVNNMETATPVAAAAQEQRATQTSLQEQTDGKHEVAEPEGKQLAEIIQKHPEQADAYRVALAGAPDYHGFLDDLRPGAIRQIRSVLEAVGSPFGAGKGSMPVKRLMESLARSPYTKENTKETSSGAAQYMLNGNRVPKAAYRYYQHLKSIGYSGEQESGKKNIAYTDGSFSDKSKNDNAMRGTVKNGIMTIWRKSGKKKDTPIITVSVDEVNQALKQGGANSEYTLHQLAKQKDHAAVEAWIKGTKKPDLRQKRRDYWEEDKLYPSEDRAIDSAVSVIKKLYETATGEPPRSPWEKHQEAKKNAPETRAEEHESGKGMADAIISDPAWKKLEGQLTESGKRKIRDELPSIVSDFEERNGLVVGHPVSPARMAFLSLDEDFVESPKTFKKRSAKWASFNKEVTSIIESHINKSQEDNSKESQESAAQEEGSKKNVAKDGSIFGSVEDADREMLDALGISEDDLQEEVLEAPPGISNTAEERERLEQELAAELNKLSANPVFNPKIYTLGLKLAMTYVKDGYNTFKKLVTKLHTAFGDKIGPWAPALAETVRTWPKGVPFDEKKVMAISKAVGARYEGGITSLDEMQADMKKLLKGQHKSFAPMIEASYNGIRKFFDEKEAQEHGGEGKQEKGESSDAGREGRQSAATEGTGEGRPEPGGVSGAEGGNREVTRGGNPGRSERENPERAESSGVRAGAELETTAGAGDRERGSEKSVLTEGQAHPSPEETPGHDYEIKPSKTKKTPAVRFRQNIDALKLLKQLEADDRMPTPKEQAVLGNYNGWGGLKEAFLDTKMNKELRAVLTPEEYKAAQSTVNDAFYTPANIVRAVWKGVSRLGFTGGRVLDPSMGVGNFFGCMPRDMMKSSSLRGIEIDDLTSRLARMLYPSALVEHTGFEKAQLADNFYDLVISNIPFDGNHSIAGYKIHNYFFAHGMDKVRPGGLMVYITSQGSLTNSQDGARMRDYIGKKADMVAAYKLPSGAFGEAGTSVGTDIVIFRKRGEHEMKPDYAQDFQRVGKMFTYSDNSGGVPVNEYFKAHPENIIGEASKGRDQYGNDVLLVKPKEGADVAKELSKAMNKLPKDVYEPVNRTGEDSFDSIKANIKLRADDKRNHDLEYWEKDGKIYQNRYSDNAGIMAEEVPAGKKLTRLKGYLKIRSALNSLMLAEMDPDAKETTVSHLRKQLNTVYDAYVKKNGYLNDPQGQRAYIDDPSSGMVMALEKVTYTGFGAKKKIEKAEKTAIFKERTISPIKEVTSVDSPNDALLVSLRNKGRVDLPYMAKLMGSTPETVAAGLDGQIFKNPATERYETRDEYLSGNVREKLAQAENAATQDPSYQKNADALRKVVPEDLIPDEICVTMGAPWIPASDVQAFADHITGRAGSLSVKFIPSNAKWVVDGYGHSGKYEAKGIDLSDLLSDILNNKAIEIYSGRGENRTLDREATDAANVIAGDMKEDFRTWLWSDKARAKRLARYYNDNYNNTVLREYDGSHLTFPGHNEKIELKPHQKNVVWRMLQGGNTLIAHCVGAGKTFEMQAAGMEMRRLGIANKPLYILPNNVVEQFTKEFYELYPNARLLVLQNDSKTRPGYIPAVPKSTIEQKVKREDGRTETVTIPLGKLSAADRKKVTEARALRTRTLAQIKTEDWDGIIMSHSQFERLPLSPETVASFIEEQLDEVEQAITEAKEGKVDKRTLGTIENQKKKLEENLDAVMKTDPRDIGVPFEQLGIDQIFVDEADMFKNLHYTTSMDRVNGLPNSNANRSMDMYAKTRWLTNANGGRGVVFATGTPVSNTMAEMFTMMRYLDYQGLKEKGLHLFDNWLRTFGEIGSGIERNPSGSGFRKVNKVLRFINMPELTKMFRKFADVKTQDDLDLDIPKLKNGKPTIVKIAPDPVLTNYIKKEVPRRIANMAKRREDMRKGADNMLALTGDLRKMSITDSKIDALADEVAKKYEETTDVKGAQLIFCDQGIPKAEKDNAKESDTESDDGTETENASVYGKIIESLEERGVPKEQIVFIQSAKNKAQMEEIFKKVDSGDIRILIGSTQKMGAGTNCQHHLVALHDLDAPWRPRDLEQRHGRILRQGNPNKEVEIFNYVLQDSFDPIMWEKLKNKASIVAQAMSSNMQQRTVEDADLVTLTYADAENAGTSDPLVKERIALDSEIKKYKHAQVAFHRKMSEAEHTVETAPKKIEELKDAVAKIKDDMGVRQDTRGDKFHMTVAGKDYTERKEAQTALGGTLAELTSKSSMKIGEISGFDIKAYAGNDGRPHIQLVRKRAYMANTATVAGIENALRKAPETLLGAREEELREKEESLKTAKDVIGQTNPYAEKLAGMEKRFKEINQQIEKNMLGKADDSKEESETPDEAYSVEEQAAAKERAIDDLKQEVRDALPGAHSIEDEGDTVSFTMPNGARVQVLLSPSIELNDTSAAKARAAHGVKPEARLRINGRERTVGRTALIELSQLGRTGSAYHETFHAVYDMCLTDKERAALHKAYGKEAKATGRDVLEVMADKYRDWKLAKQKGQHVPFGKLWQKIKDAAGRLLRVIRGVDHASDVFRRVESGEVWERPARTGNQKKYSVEGVENQQEAGYNEDKVSKAVFDKYLNDGIMQMVRETVAKEIGKHVDLAKMNDPVAREAARDRLPYIRKMLTHYNILKGQKKGTAYLDRYAAKIEYARRCFDNDSRIGGKAAGGVGQYDGQSNMDPSRYENYAKSLSRGGGESGGRSSRGVSRSVSGEKSGARAHFEKLYNDMADSRSDTQDGFSSAQNPMHYSAEAEEAPKSFAKKAFLKFAKRSHIKGEKIVVEEQNDAKSTMSLTNYVLSSPSRIADKVQAFRLFYRMGTRAMDTLTKHRSDYARKLGEAMDFVKKKSDRQALYEILLNGDAEGKEYTRQELADDGISDNVIEAYTRIRRLMTKAYRMVDDAHRRPKVVSKRMTDKKIAELRENHFVEIMRVGTEEDDGRRLVTYKEYANHEKVYKGIDDDTFRRFREDDSIQILADRGNDDGTFDVKVREGISHMNRLGGYIPHFFHDYMIRVKDSDGGYVTTLGSGRTEREAVKKAEAYLKEHALPEGQKIYISPKVMDFTTLGMSEQQYGAVMGDKDYFKMLSSIAKNNDLAYEDAKALIEGSARMKNRHRFFGNAMHRTGVKGYETDLGWVLRHYFNSASRYAALETEFKPQAISLYERLYGDFNHDAPSKEADYTKDYINDINGNPSTLEIAINEALMKSKWFRQFIVPRFGDRAALTLGSKLSNAVSYMCLGYFNTSSAFLNLTQVMNSAAYIGDVSTLAKCIAKGAHRKYSMHDLKILVETNVLNDIGLDSGSGYDMNRMSAKSLLGKLNRGGMWMFKTSEGVVRRGTVLAAYEAGRKRGMTHEEAIAFAKDVNRKSNFDYGVSDAPNIFRRGSIVSQLALQFKKYGIKELEVMADMFPTNSKTSRKQKAIFWGTYFLTAGLMGLPMLDFFDKWPFDGKLKLSVEECLMEVAGGDPLGKKLATAALFGVAAAVPGIDLSNRAGLSDVIPTRGSDLMGATLSKTANLISDSLKGNGMSAIRDVSPGIYNIVAAARGYSEGKRGRVNDRYNTFYDRVLRAMGFKSTDERVNSDIDRIVNMRKSKEAQEKQDAIDAYLENPSTENAGRLKALGVKPKAVADERKKKQQSRRERTQSGMSKPKQQENERLMQFGD